ncbi:SDR family oxidoreductase [Flagellimonas myxillae]|uniref:SDR family oxidoreductase n=1 Tax=Flagellimonas myxillae TaxID=2942214 RepID=UPI00201EE748|nr:SDR family oxidoreductase [Muricauda myxillae]MCL6266989.1 SDR family oxidoreductase [Muricauda myxillae]
MNKKIGVLGCGWLGLPLAKTLLEKGYKVYGTTSTQTKLATLKAEGIESYSILLSETRIEGDIQDFLSNIDVLIVNIPPRLRGSNNESFVAKMKLLQNALTNASVENVLFISSTAVYGDVSGEVTEETIPRPSTASGTQLLQVENLLRDNPSFRTTVIRFGGLVGPQRNPTTMLSGKESLSNGNDPINLIHLNDCIQMICTILEKGYWNQLFNGVYPYHPQKKDFYTEQALKLGIPAPTYLDNPKRQAGKIVLSQNFLNKSHFFYTPIDT